MTTSAPHVEIDAGTINGAQIDAGKPSALQTPHELLGSKNLGLLFRPRWFLVGALVGFVLCCYLGYLTTLKNQFGNITRFGILSGPEVFLYPTLRQLLALTQSRLAPGQTLVLIGGNSVLNGVGQSKEEVWTKKLQSDLGPRYCVVNLGLRSCEAYEGAYFVAEALFKKHEKVIFVTYAMPGETWDPVGRPPYAHLYWEGKYGNLLCDFPERDKSIALSETRMPNLNWTAQSLSEQKLASWLNSQCNFLELWGTAGYRYFFTAYTRVADTYSFFPRKKIPDDLERNEYFPMPSDEYLTKFFNTRFQGAFNWDAQHSKWVADKNLWQNFAQTVDLNVLPGLRPHTLVLLTYQHPGHRKKYSTGNTLQLEKLSFDQAESILRSKGVHTLKPGRNYEPKDYRDPMHLSASGGNKLATEVAQEVKKMAKDLGYE